MGDFSFEDLKDPKQCQTMWGIANKTIEMQKKRIVYLQSRVFFLINSKRDLQSAQWAISVCYD
jgi:hypothetical protein